MRPPGPVGFKGDGVPGSSGAVGEIVVWVGAEGVAETGSCEAEAAKVVAH